MSFYTSLTGLNAATTMLGVTANNIANVGTTGFKRSRADFGDIFATSPLQKATNTVGQGVALKQVSQEFTQGNIAFSANSLDLAITGDGFFPMQATAGQPYTYTRNGQFMLNEQHNVVNAAGERLRAATVDSAGTANVNDQVDLTIPPKTTGEATQTSKVSLSLNFPADAAVITEAFDSTNPATYNKSSALTVYDAGGHGYLATVYYTKTRNADVITPTNTWQTHVFVDGKEVPQALKQATDASGQPIYVNQYGQTKPLSEVKDLLTTAPTQLFALNDLTDTRSSTAAAISGAAVDMSKFDLSNGVNFQAFSTDLKAALSSVLKVKVDGSAKEVTVNLSGLANETKVTGAELASAITNQLQRQFGSENYYDLTDPSNQKFRVTTDGMTGPDGIAHPITINLNSAAFPADTNLKTLKTEEVVAAIQAQLDANAGNTGKTIKVSYDYANSGFKFTDGNNAITLDSGTLGSASNDLFGLSQFPTSVNLTTGNYGAQVIPNGKPICPLVDQRFGMAVHYDSVTKKFNFSSGTTGDTSSLSISGVQSGSLANELLGLAPIPDGESLSIATSEVALRGLPSTAAKVTGAPPVKNLANIFSVDASNNTFQVTIDGIRGKVVVPPRSDYSIDSFAKALQKGINALGANNAYGDPVTVNGVKVGYDPVKKGFTITSGTAGNDSYVKISGSADWGLADVDANYGADSTWTKPTQQLDASGALKYIDGKGKETTSNAGFTKLPAWSPVFLTKGQLTFSTTGKLISPTDATQLDTVFLDNGKGALNMSVEFSGSTQYGTPFSVLSQSQNGAPEGDLVGVTIGNDGLVTASFSNGSSKSLAKILMANFATPVGLRPMGDSSFSETKASGKPTLGTAGSAGFGTLRSGATERANVDLTQELVDLITAQRNFQANAKAIETSSTMTSAIINLRS